MPTVILTTLALTLRAPGTLPKSNQFLLVNHGPAPFQKYFSKIRRQFLGVILLTDRQTDRQMKKQSNAEKNVFPVGGNKTYRPTFKERYAVVTTTTRFRFDCNSIPDSSSLQL